MENSDNISRVEDSEQGMTFPPGHSFNGSLQLFLTHYQENKILRYLNSIKGVCLLRMRAKDRENDYVGQDGLPGLIVQMIITGDENQVQYITDPDMRREFRYDPSLEHHTTHVYIKRVFRGKQEVIPQRILALILENYYNDVRYNMDFNQGKMEQEKKYAQLIADKKILILAPFDMNSL